MNDIVLIPLKPQPHLDAEARRRMWTAIRAELLATIGAVAIHEKRHGAIVFGLSSEWLLTLEPKVAVRLAPRIPIAVGTPAFSRALQRLKQLSARHPALFEAPIISKAR